MSRRIEIELTSQRPDGTWTWRAAGAKQPKGELDGSLIPEGLSTGSVVKADADFTIDGIEILSISTSKRVRKEPELLAVVGSGRELPGVTTTLVEKKGRGDRDRRPRRDRDDRGERGDRGDRRDRTDRGQRREGGRRGDERDHSRGRGSRGDSAPERSRPKRLQAGRAHRAKVLESLPPEQQPIAEQVLIGGLPAVRDALAKQNEQAKKENRPEIPGDQLVDLAEKLLPLLRAAEWRDRADAALADIDEIDLRDLRSVVSAADAVSRDPEVVAIKDQIQEALLQRVEREHTQWLDDMKANLDSGRFIRVLRLTSRPPKAGTAVPVDISSRLISTLQEKLTADLSQDLWAQTLDALAFSPVRSSVSIKTRPESPTAELLEAVKRVGARLPEIAALFGFDPEKLAEESRRSRPARGSRGRGRAASKGASGKPEDSSGSGKSTEADSAGSGAPEEEVAPSAQDQEPSKPEQAGSAAEAESADSGAGETAGAEPEQVEQVEQADSEVGETASAEPASSEPEQAGSEDGQPEAADAEATATEQTDSGATESGESAE